MLHSSVAPLSPYISVEMCMYVYKVSLVRNNVIESLIWISDPVHIPSAHPASTRRRTPDTDREGPQTPTELDPRHPS